MAVKVIVEHSIHTLGGKEYPVTITHRLGLDTYYNKAGEPFLADAASFIDWGPKMGTTRVYEMHPEIEPTEEERAAGRQHIKDVAVQCLIDQGIW